MSAPPTDGEVRLALIHHAAQVAARLEDSASPEAKAYLRRILTAPPDQVRAHLAARG